MNQARRTSSIGIYLGALLIILFFGFLLASRIKSFSLGSLVTLFFLVNAGILLVILFILLEIKEHFPSSDKRREYPNRIFVLTLTIVIVIAILAFFSSDYISEDYMRKSTVGRAIEAIGIQGAQGEHGNETDTEPEAQMNETFHPKFSHFSCFDTRINPSTVVNPHTEDIATQIERYALLDTLTFDCLWRGYRYVQEMEENTPQNIKPLVEAQRREALRWGKLGFMVYRDQTTKVLRAANKQEWILGATYPWFYPTEALRRLNYAVKLNPDYVIKHPDKEIMDMLDLKIEGSKVVDAHLHKPTLRKSPPPTESNHRFGALQNRPHLQPLTPEMIMLIDEAQKLHTHWVESIWTDKDPDEVAVIVEKHHDAHRALESLSRSTDEQNLLTIHGHTLHNICWERPEEEVMSLVVEADKSHSEWTNAVKKLDFKAAWFWGLQHSRDHVMLATCNVSFVDMLEFMPEIREEKDNDALFTCKDVHMNQNAAVHPQRQDYTTQTERRQLLETRMFDCFWQSFRYVQKMRDESPEQLMPSIQAKMDLAQQKMETAMSSYASRVSDVLNGIYPSFVLSGQDYYFGVSSEAMVRLREAMALNPLWVKAHPDRDIFTFLNAKVRETERRSRTEKGKAPEFKSTVMIVPAGLLRTDLRQGVNDTDKLAKQNFGAITKNMKFPQLSSEDTARLDELAQLHSEWEQAVRQRADSEVLEGIAERHMMAHKRHEMHSSSSGNRQALQSIHEHTFEVCYGRTDEELKKLVDDTAKTHAEWINSVKTLDYKSAWAMGIRHAQSHVLLSTCRIELFEQDKTSAPEILPAEGIYTAPVIVKMGSKTPGAAIYYTTDGAEPTQSSTVYRFPFSLSSNVTIRAKAIRQGFKISDTSIATYTFITGIKQAAKPAISPNGGIFEGSQLVVLTTTTPGALIYYTLDGSEPSANSILYSGLFLIDHNLTVKAKSLKDGYSDSPVANATFIRTQESEKILLLHWTFDEGTGMIVGDSSGKENDGTLGSNAVWAEGRAGGALILNGTRNSYVHLNPIKAFPSKEISVAFWLKSNDTFGEGTPFSYAAGTHAGRLDEFLVFRTRSLIINIRDSGAGVTSVSANDGIWHHFVVTWRVSDGALKVYKDGVLSHTGKITEPQNFVFQGGGWLMIGQDHDMTGNVKLNRALIGLIDDVRLYSGILNSGDVKTLYDSYS